MLGNFASIVDGTMAVFRSKFLVIGSGVAGLNSALDASKYGTVQLVTKKQDFESNTNYAQGGIASVLDHSDSFESHIRDTLEAGAGLCHIEAVRLIVTHGPEAIDRLIQVGVEFTRSENGVLELGREGGHSFRRIVHAKDLTGREVEKALLANVRANPKIDVHEFFLGSELVLDANGRCWGARVWDERTHQMHLFLASVTILCTGGCGLVYKHSTNPPIATGDGVAMAFRVGARVGNMEFIQFHPTAFNTEDHEQPFLISEAVRGEGAILRTQDGAAFMDKYHALKDLAPRDIVARAIDNEMKQRGDSFVYLDVRHLGLEFFRHRFPNISKYCEERGLDLSCDMIPVVPAAHYMCGGVITNYWGETSIPGLYAIGENGCTGVHGANRLASNSILEAVVFSILALKNSLELGMHEQQPPVMDGRWEHREPTAPLEAIRLVHCRQTLRQVMWDYVGIVRSTERLQLALRRVRLLKEEIEGYIEEGHINYNSLELRNLLQVGELIILCALQRKESRGLHYNLDYPHTSPFPMDTHVVMNKDEKFQIESVPIPGEKN